MKKVQLKPPSPIRRKSPAALSLLFFVLLCLEVSSSCANFLTTDGHGWTRILSSLSVFIRVHPWLIHFGCRSAALGLLCFFVATFFFSVEIAPEPVSIVEDSKKRIPEWRRGAPNLSAFLRVLCASGLKKFETMAQRLFVGFEPRLYTVVPARKEPEVRRIMLQKLIRQFSVFQEYPEAVNSARYAQQCFRAETGRSVCAESRRHRHGSTRCRGWMRGGWARRPSNWQARRLSYGSRS